MYCGIPDSSKVWSASAAGFNPVCDNTGVPFVGSECWARR